MRVETAAPPPDPDVEGDSPHPATNAAITTVARKVDVAIRVVIVPSCLQQAGSPSLPLSQKSLIPVERVERAILFLRGRNVIIDADLASLYEVETKALLRAVKRNIERFPPDFMFQLTRREFARLRCQFGTSKSRGGRRYRPCAFTEQGVAMLSSVLRNPRAVAVNIEIMRAFVNLRQLLGSNVELAKRLEALERKYDGQFHEVFQAIRELMAAPKRPLRTIGFRDSGSR